MNKLCSTLYIW